MITEKQLPEAYRVISKQGIAILQVPAYCPDKSTKEAIGMDSERITAFGDPKIYRCDTDKDYRTRLRESGFFVQSFASDFYQNDERKRWDCMVKLSIFVFEMNIIRWRNCLKKSTKYYKPFYYLFRRFEKNFLR